MFSVNRCYAATRGQHSLFFLYMVALLSLVSAPLFAYSSYNAKSFADISAAIASIGQKEAILTVSTRQRISRDLVISPNISLNFEQGGSFITDKGITVTITSAVKANYTKIFEGSGTVVVKKGKVFPQWWGAKGDGFNDDGYAIQAAIDSVHAAGGGVVHIPRGTYLLNHIHGVYYALKGRDKVSVSGDGKLSILKVGAGLRTDKQGIAVLYNHEEIVSHCRYADFSVDYNGEANPYLASWGKDAKAGTVSRLGAEFAADMIIENINFKNTSGAHCVYIGNQPTNENNAIRNCSVSNVGQSIPGNQLDDHSSIYIGGRRGVVTGNTFYNKIPCNISTAIEIHSSETTVSNNTVTNYATAVNIAGEANDCSDVALTNNVFRNCRNGVVLWHYSPFVMKDMLISSNSISVREPDAPYPPSMGIIYGNGYVTSNVNMSGLKITNNTIYQERIDTTGTKPNTAIHLESVDNVTISGNTIYNFKGEAIYVQSRSATQGMSGIRIYGNNISDVGRTQTNDRKRAIVFNAYRTPAGSISQIQVQNNKITGNVGNPMISGISFNSGIFPQVLISDNSITGTASFEILNNSEAVDNDFQIVHAGKGSPGNLQRASNGSKWTDMTTGRVFTYSGGAWK